jgi:hypothetical protein
VEGTRIPCKITASLTIIHLQESQFVPELTLERNAVTTYTTSFNAQELRILLAECTFHTIMKISREYWGMRNVIETGLKWVYVVEARRKESETVYTTNLL